MDTKHGRSLNRKAWTEADKENFKALSMDERNEWAMASYPSAVSDREHCALAERHGLRETDVF